MHKHKNLRIKSIIFNNYTYHINKHCKLYNQIRFCYSIGIMSYIIVEYLDDNTIEVVPKKWIKNDTCPWDKSLEFKRCIKQQFDAPIHFKRYAIRRIGDYESHSYKYALEKLLEAQYTSNLSSEEETVSKSNRIYRPPGKYRLDKSNTSFVFSKYLF